MAKKGPLAGLRILEIASLGPGPFAAMMLGDLGAEIIRIDRPGACDEKDELVGRDLMRRGRRSIALDLKNPEAVEIALRLVDSSDGLIEGYRPGVMERLGLGPEQVLARNPRLVYGRVTGWGRSGPYAQMAGHDINYVALTGVLNAIGRAGSAPAPAPAVVGDMAGGGLMLAFGMVSAFLERARSGLGQVVDTAVADAVALLSTMYYADKLAMDDGKELSHAGPRGTNIGDSGAHFLDAYETSDGKFVAIAAVEAKFYKQFIELIGLDLETVPHSFEPADWPRLKAIVAERMKSRTRDEWCALLDGTDACFSPVLSFEEARTHPHFLARSTFVPIGGFVQPAPGPLFGRSQPGIPVPPVQAGSNTKDIMRELGIDDAVVTALIERDVARDTSRA